MRQVISGGTSYDRVVNVFKVPYQVVYRELLWNALEAGASHVRFGWDPHYRENAGVWKARCIDNGSGMSPESILQYFQTIGSSSKGGKNFGHGLRLSALRRNPLGLVFVSRVADAPWYLAHMRVDHDRRECYLQTYSDPTLDLDDPDREEDTVVPLEWTPFDYIAHDPIVREVVGDGSGTVVLLLGETSDDSTYLAQAEKADGRLDPAETMSIETYLSTRAEFLWNAKGQRLGQGLRVEVETIGAGPERLGEVRHGSHLVRTSSVTDLDGFIPPPAASSAEQQRIEAEGSLSVSFADLDVESEGEAAKIRWVLLSEPPLSAKSRADGLTKARAPSDYVRTQRSPNKGAVAHAYEGELYECYWRLGLDRRKFAQFGIDMPLTQCRVYVIVRWASASFVNGRIAKPGVWPAADRMHLEFHVPERADLRLPVTDVAAVFRERMPKAIREALDQEAREAASHVTTVGEDLRKLVSRFRERFQFRPVYGRAPGPHEGAFAPGGVDGGGLRGTGSSKRGGRGRPGGKSEGSRGGQFIPGAGADQARPKRPEAYDVHFGSVDELTAFGVPREEAERTPVCFRHDMILVNKDHSLYQTLVLNCKQACPDVSIERVAASTEKVIRNRMVAQVMMFLGHRRDMVDVTASTPMTDVLHPRVLAFGLCTVDALVSDVKSDVRG